MIEVREGVGIRMQSSNQQVLFDSGSELRRTTRLGPQADFL